MSETLARRLCQQIEQWELVDPHTHINPHSPASTTLADVLGYHYYTELAHSAGLPRQNIEEAGLDPREKVRRLVHALAPLDNTIQYAWLIEMCQRLFGFDADRLTPENWEALYERSQAQMAAADWPNQVLARSRLRAVFLTNDFDDPLSGFDTARYIPCLRTDDLVFHLAKPEVRQRLRQASGVDVGSAATLEWALGQLFAHFTGHGARACAISLPPDFSPEPVSAAAADAAWRGATTNSPDAEAARRLGQFVFWKLAELCAAHRLPFDLMIGVNRRVYEAGVYQGQDLFDSRVSLIQYRALFNAFPGVKFPISVLASVTNQELTSYSWIFPNVLTNGHWWYSNIPSYIEFDAAARLEAVPRTKQIAYYSDMYKLEFALPKFSMYRRVLAKILAERFVQGRGWSEERALGLARQVLCDNVEQVFFTPAG